MNLRYNPHPKVEKVGGIGLGVQFLESEEQSLDTKIIAKEKAVKKEVTKLKKIFSDLTNHQKDISIRIIDEIAFLTIELQELREYLRWNGTVEEMQQGEYVINRRSPQFQNYLDCAKTYQSLYKLILDMYPKADQNVKVTAELDGVQQFLKKHPSR